MNSIKVQSFSWFAMNKLELSQRLDEFGQDLRYQEKSKRTIMKYQTAIEMFIDSIKHDRDITKDDVIDFKEKIQRKGYRPSYINGILIAVNKYLKWAGQKDLSVKKIKSQAKNSLEDVVSNTDLKRLQRFAKRLGYEDIYLVMEIITKTGIRIGELDFFTVEAIESFYIQVFNKGKVRDIILTQELRRMLKHYCRENKITTGRIINLSDRQIRRRMHIIAGAARVNKTNVHPHSFRHLFAKNYMEKFNNPLELKDILGHSDLRSTGIYTQSTKEEKRKKLEKL